MRTYVGVKYPSIPYLHNMKVWVNFLKKKTRR
nr:MAG TPA: hypothetical protein [Caudoviricetes sp.]